MGEERDRVWCNVVRMGVKPVNEEKKEKKIDSFEEKTIWTYLILIKDVSEVKVVYKDNRLLIPLVLSNRDIFACNSLPFAYTAEVHSPFALKFPSSCVHTRGPRSACSQIPPLSPRTVSYSLFCCVEEYEPI